MPRIGSDHWYRCEDRLFAGRLRISILRRSSSDRFGALVSIVEIAGGDFGTT
jgi:hypothetical protein